MEMPQRVCQICGDEIAQARLIDMNNHTWHIGAECINYLWRGRQQLNQERRFQEAAIEYVLGKLQEVLSGGENGLHS